MGVKPEKEPSLIDMTHMIVESEAKGEMTEKEEASARKRICLVHFDAKRCRYGIPMNVSKEEQVAICQNMKCDYGTITELKGGKVLVVSCDFTWNPFNNREVTEREYLEDYP